MKWIVHCIKARFNDLGTAQPVTSALFCLTSSHLERWNTTHVDSPLYRLSLVTAAAMALSPGIHCVWWKLNIKSLETRAIFICALYEGFAGSDGYKFNYCTILQEAHSTVLSLGRAPSTQHDLLLVRLDGTPRARHRRPTPPAGVSVTRAKFRRSEFCKIFKFIKLKF